VGETEVVLGWPALGEPWQAVSARRAQRAAAAVPRAGRGVIQAPIVSAVGVRVSYGGCSEGRVIHRLQVCAMGCWLRLSGGGRDSGHVAIGSSSGSG